MSKSSKDASSRGHEHPGRRRLRSSVQVFENHREARAHEIAQQARLTPYQRMQQFMELQDRIWGSGTPDIRESGAVNIERRDR